MTRRIALLAGYDPDGRLHDHVVHLVGCLSVFSEVHCLFDNAIAATERQKLDGLATVHGGYRHGRYDFGSWADMIAALGWATIEQFDELILVNDSCYGPLFDLEPICDAMTSSTCDYWGMTSSREISFHLQSYFLVFKKSVIDNADFRKFWSEVVAENFYNDIVKKYEVGLSTTLIRNGLSHESYIDSRLNENLTTFPITTIKDKNLPFIKIKVFRSPYLSSRERISLLWIYLKKNHSDMAGMIARHLGKGFLTSAMAEQALEPPIYFNCWFFRMRSIRNHRLKIMLFDRWKIIIPMSRSVMKKLSRFKSFHVHM